MGDIRATVREFVVENFMSEGDSSSFTDETDLKESGILDSFSTLNLVSFLENQFHIRLEADDVESGNLFSVVRIEKLVQSRRGLHS